MSPSKLRLVFQVFNIRLLIETVVRGRFDLDNTRIAVLAAERPVGNVQSTKWPEPIPSLLNHCAR
jgi:hypothetical protein